MKGWTGSDNWLSRSKWAGEPPGDGEIADARVRVLPRHGRRAPSVNLQFLRTLRPWGVSSVKLVGRLLRQNHLLRCFPGEELGRRCGQVICGALGWCGQIRLGEAGRDRALRLLRRSRLRRGCWRGVTRERGWWLGRVLRE